MRSKTEACLHRTPPKVPIDKDLGRESRGRDRVIESQYVKRHIIGTNRIMQGSVDATHKSYSIHYL